MRMYPWHQSLNAWSERSGIRIDALGLVTLLGAEEMDRNVGRLMPSQCFDYLPLLGAFTVAGNRFTEMKTGYSLYNISAGMMTGELAGWFSRWLQAQHFHKVRSKVTWEVVDRPHRWRPVFINLLIGVSLQGMLVAMTVLTADWWGFANAMAMIISVMVRCAQVAENQSGIDENIRMAEKEVKENFAKYEKAKAHFEDLRCQGIHGDETKSPVPPRDREHVKVIVVTADSRVVTVDAPGFLIKPAFTSNPHIPNPVFYLVCRAMGWIAFAVHVISIGMSVLHTQIYSVVLIIVSTVLAAYRIGCQDSQVMSAIWKKMYHVDEDNGDNEWSCWVTSRLKGTVSSYPVEYTDWEGDTLKMRQVTAKTYSLPRGPWNRRNTVNDLEHSAMESGLPAIQERRQDLYAWLDLTEEEDKRLVAWGLIPHSEGWKDVYRGKKEKHRRRTRPEA